MFIYQTINRKNKPFLEEFIRSDGLESLSKLIGSESLYMRGQAIEIFMSITDSDMIDWFRMDEQRHLLDSKLLKLYKSSSFVSNLLSNRTLSYPGGSFRCLQLLAFWMSWVRVTYTSCQILLPSPYILLQLDLWRSSSEADHSEDELKLAEAVFSDFSSQRISEAIEISSLSKYHSQNNKNLYFVGIIDPFDDTADLDTPEMRFELSGSSQRIEVSVDNIDEVTHLKEKGDFFFKNNESEKALEMYTSALSLLKLLGSTNKSIECSLYFNQASSMWRIAKGIKAHDNLENVGLTERSSYTTVLEGCEDACVRALALNAKHVKAAYRLASVLIALKKYDEAVKTIGTFCNTLVPEQICSGVKDNISSKGPEDLQELPLTIFEDLKRVCIASLIVQSQSINTVNLNIRTKKVLGQLQRRNAREKQASRR